MLSLRQRLKERWNKTGTNTTGENAERETFSVQEQVPTEIPTPNLSGEARNVGEAPAEHLHFIVDYIGSSAISEAKSVQILSETLKRVKKQQLRTMRVDFNIRDGILKVSCVESSALLITSPLYAVALCAQEQLRGFDNCFALNITRKKLHMCHVFEAGSRLEAASVVRSVAVAFKTIGRLLREKRGKEERQRRTQSMTSSERTCASEASTVTSIDEALRASQRRHTLYREKMDRESSSSSMRWSPKSKRSRNFPKTTTSPSFLRHGGAALLSGRHVEFSALSPVPSDSSDNEANNSGKNGSQDMIVKAEVHVSPMQTLQQQLSPHETTKPTPQELQRPETHIPSDTTQQSPISTTQNTPKYNQQDTATEPLKLPPNVTQTTQDTVIPRQKEQLLTLPSTQHVTKHIQLEKKEDNKENVCKGNINKENERISVLDQELPGKVVHRQSPQSFLDEDVNFKPALEAILSGNVAALESYLEAGLSENASDGNQRSLLYFSILNGQCDAAVCLLKRGAEVNWEGPEDRTPLHIAASEGNRTATKILLRYGANVRAKDSAFCTPLHLSVGHKQNLEVSHLLVEHGARINENSLQGVRPVDMEPQLKEMQRLHVQSACEAFTAADLSKSRSNSNTSSYNYTSLCIKTTTNQSPRLERIGSLSKGHRCASLSTIPRGGLVRGSPETPRNMRRSESFNTPPMFSPQLGRGKRPLRRSLSFQKCTMDLEFQLKLDARIESDAQESTSITSTHKPHTHPPSSPSHKQDLLFPPHSSTTNAEEQDSTTHSSTAKTTEPLLLAPSTTKTQEPLSPTLPTTKTQEPLSPTPTPPTTKTQEPLSPTLLSINMQEPLSPTSATTKAQEPLSPSTISTKAQEPLSPSTISTKVQEPLSPPPLSIKVQEPLSPPYSATECNVKQVDHDCKVERGERSGYKAQLKNIRQHSEDSEQSGACQRSVSEFEDSSYMSGGSHFAHDEDPVIDALKSIVLLSGNPECHKSLLAYLCLPRASSQLIGLAHMPSTIIADDVAVLIGNLFNLEGPESRKRSVEAGLIKTVLRLVDGAEPIQSTCLSILHNILDFDNDREYSAALQSIPVEPLLNLLHISDTDSAFDTRATDSPPLVTTRRRKMSTCSRGSYDDGQLSISVQRNNSGGSDVRPGRLYHKRSSISSMTSSGEGDPAIYSSSYGHGHLPWASIVPDMHITKNLPRLVATKMLAATTMNPKMQRELGKEMPLTLMLETLQDSNNDIVMHTTAALANIGMNINNHQQLQSSHIIETFLSLLNHNDARVTYHAARGLIYLGHMDVNGIYLFKHITGDDKVDVIFADTTGSEHLYVKGATVEKIIEIATNNPSILWGGARLQPPSPKGAKNGDKKTSSNGSKKANDDQIIDFLLTMHSGFVHPIVLMRLLIHRFRDPWFDKYFDGNPATGQIEDYAPLPTVHIHLMRIWKMWLDRYPQDFISNPIIAAELSFLIIPMTRAGGPYLPCAESLQALLYGLNVYSPSRLHQDDIIRENHCHHTILYEQCQKAIVSGDQPCQQDDAIYLSALQLYIEDLSPVEARSRQWFFQGTSPDKLPVSRIKHSLPPALYKVKNITKRIKVQRESFISDGLSERNAKHNYIDFCQSIAGYGCRFFKLKECQSTANRKLVHINRLFGISPKKVILLDEKTKAMVGIWQFKDIKRWNTSSDNSRLLVEISKETYEFLLENKSFVYKDLTELLFNCTRSNLEALGEKDFTPWSKYAEDTEKWGHIALEAELQDHIPTNDIDPTYDGPVNRSRAVSCIASSRGRGRHYTRHSSLVDKLSTSAPFVRNPVTPSASTTPGLAQTSTGVSSFFSRLSIGPLHGAAASSISPLSGVTSPSNQQSFASSEEFLNSGSFHRALHYGMSNVASYRKAPLARNISCESEVSDPSPTESNPLNPSLSDIISPSGPPTRHRYLSSGSTSSSVGCPSPGYVPKEPDPIPQGIEDSGLNFESESFNQIFGLSPCGQLLICRCPPDALLPGFDRRNFTAFQLLQHPKELARQITFIDHEYFCAVTSEDILKKVAIGTGRKKTEQETRLLVERVADRFNQLSTWVVASMLTEDSPEKRAIMFENFIETAKQCLEFRNFNAVMAIVVAALGSAPIRRLARTKQCLSKDVLELHCKFETLMDPKDNYKRYRTTLRSSPTPAVPFFGVYMKDLTFIAEGNPDLLKGGLVNLSKRRQTYLVINEIRKFQRNSYNFQEVAEIREYLLSQKLVTEEDLHQISRQIEPTLLRRCSEPEKETRSFSIPTITRSNTTGQTTGKKLVKSLSLGGESLC